MKERKNKEGNSQFDVNLSVFQNDDTLSIRLDIKVIGMCGVEGNWIRFNGVLETS